MALDLSRNQPVVPRNASHFDFPAQHRHNTSNLGARTLT